MQQTALGQQLILNGIESLFRQKHEVSFKYPLILNGIETHISNGIDQ